MRRNIKFICSKNRRENHIVIVVESKDEESMKNIVEELKKTIHKENRLLKDGVSFQINCNIKKT